MAGDITYNHASPDMSAGIYFGHNYGAPVTVFSVTEVRTSSDALHGP